MKLVCFFTKNAEGEARLESKLCAIAFGADLLRNRGGSVKG